MIKKIAAIAGATALLLTVASPALASRSRNRGHESSGTTNTAFVLNGASAVSDTGNNYQSNSTGGQQENTLRSRHHRERESGDVKGNSITTGGATADADAVVIANTNLNGCGCESEGRRHENGGTQNTAFVGNGATALANTGWNDQYNTAGGGDVENNSIGTGAASSDADAWVVVNTNVSGL